MKNVNKLKLDQIKSNIKINHFSAEQVVTGDFLQKSINPKSIILEEFLNKFKKELIEKHAIRILSYKNLETDFTHVRASIDYLNINDYKISNIAVDKDIFRYNELLFHESEVVLALKNTYPEKFI